jgi:histidinol-phosphate aminotransferase
MPQQAPPWVTSAIPPHILTIPPYVPGKPVAELERQSGVVGALKMASNENPLGPSPLAVEALEGHLREAHVYPESSAPQLREALAHLFGLSVDSVLLGNGSDEIMQMAAHLFIRPGTEAVMPANTFSMYRIVVEAFGGTPVRIPLKEYRIDLTAMAKAVTDVTRLVFLAVPNNPTGTIVSGSEFESFCSDMPAERLLLVVDEAYREYVRDRDCPDGVASIGRGLPVLVLRTFSKIYGLAGLRVGYGLGDPWLIEMLNRVRPPFNVNSLAQVAALAAMKDAEHLERSLKVTREGLAFLSTELEGLGMKVIPSQANFVTFCADRDARALYEALLQEGVIVRHLASFGMEKCIRVTVGRDEDNERFIGALKKVLS